TLFRSALDRDAELVLDVLAQRLQHLGRELLGLFLGRSSGKVDRPAGAHQALELGRRIRGILFDKAPRAGSDRGAALLVDAHDRRRDRRTLCIANDRDALAVEHGGGRVGRSEIDPDVERPEWGSRHLRGSLAAGTTPATLTLTLTST